MCCCIFFYQNAYRLPPFPWSICISHYLCHLVLCLGWRYRIHESPRETLMLWIYDNHILKLHYFSSTILNHKILELQVILVIIQYNHFTNEDTGAQKEIIYQTLTDDFKIKDNLNVNFLSTYGLFTVLQKHGWTSKQLCYSL